MGFKGGFATGALLGAVIAGSASLGLMAAGAAKQGRSLRARATENIVGLTKLRYRDEPTAQRGLSGLVRWFNQRSYPVPASLLSSRLERRVIKGIEVLVFHPQSTPPSARPDVFYLHGGGYFMRPLPVHIIFADALATRRGVCVYLPLYDLSPQGHALDVVPRVIELFDALASTSTHGMSIAGDSAGGGLALIVSQHQLTEARTMPRGIVLLSPWVDLRPMAEEAGHFDGDDVMLGTTTVNAAAQLWARDVALEDPILSPILGPMKGLPPVRLFYGSHEVFYPQITQLRARLGEAGVEVDATVLPQGPHVWVLFPTPEGKKARREIIFGDALG